MSGNHSGNHNECHQEFGLVRYFQCFVIQVNQEKEGQLHMNGSGRQFMA